MADINNSYFNLIFFLLLQHYITFDVLKFRATSNTNQIKLNHKLHLHVPVYNCMSLQTLFAYYPGLRMSYGHYPFMPPSGPKNIPRIPPFLLTIWACECPTDTAPAWSWLWQGDVALQGYTSQHASASHSPPTKMDLKKKKPTSMTRTMHHNIYLMRVFLQRQLTDDYISEGQDSIC